MARIYDFSKITVYLGYLPLDRVMADQIRHIFEREGFTVLDTEHSALSMSEYQDNVKNLEQADIALLVLSPEAASAAHLWREVMTCKTRKTPYIPVMVDEMTGHVQLTNIFDARSHNFDELRGRLLWGVCTMVVRHWSAMKGITIKSEREALEAETLRLMRNQLMQQAQQRTHEARQIRKTQATQMLRQAERRRKDTRKHRTQVVRSAQAKRTGGLAGLLSRLTG